VTGVALGLSPLAKAHRSTSLLPPPKTHSDRATRAPWLACRPEMSSLSRTSTQAALSLLRPQIPSSASSSSQPTSRLEFLDTVISEMQN